MLRSLCRTFATLSPKPTSKRSKARFQLLPGMPRMDITKKQSRSPLFNHVLRANKELSRRERHFRRCVVQAQCATMPHNPDLSTFVPPYWLNVSSDPVEVRKQLPGVFDPFVQSVANPRINNAIAARADPDKCKLMLSNNVVCEKDLEEVEEMIRRRECPSNVPLIDRVLMDVEKELATGTAPMFQHSISAWEVEKILGSPETDIGKALSEKRTNAELDEKRLLVERIVGLSTANATEKIKYIKHRLFEAFRRHETDYGSTEVQSAMLTLRIRNMIRHVYKCPQDTPTRVTIDHLTHRRRKLLESLRKTNFPVYMKTVRNLGLKFA